MKKSKNRKRLPKQYRSEKLPSMRVIEAPRLRVHMLENVKLGELLMARDVAIASLRDHEVPYPVCVATLWRDMPKHTWSPQDQGASYEGLDELEWIETAVQFRRRYIATELIFALRADRLDRAMRLGPIDREGRLFCEKQNLRGSRWRSAMIGDPDDGGVTFTLKPYETAAMVDEEMGDLARRVRAKEAKLDRQEKLAKKEDDD